MQESPASIVPEKMANPLFDEAEHAAVMMLKTPANFLESTCFSMNLRHATARALDVFLSGATGTPYEVNGSAKPTQT